MLLMKISQYRNDCFVEGSRPSLNTIKKWIDNGEVIGEIIGGHYYVRVDEMEPVNDLVERALSHGAQAPQTR